MDKTSFSTKAIIINNRDYKEYDNLITAYSLKRGKIDVVSRGTKKPNSKLSGHLQPFTLTNLMIIPGKGFDYIGSAFNIKTYLNIKNNLNSLYYSGKVFAFINKFFRHHEKDKDIFFLLKKYLDFLDDQVIDNKKQEVLMFACLLKMVSLLGYHPQLHFCFNCQTKISPQNNYFDFLNGSIWCNKCYSQIPDKRHVRAISERTLRIIKFLLSQDFSEINKLKNVTKQDYNLFSRYFKYLE